jgi:hypothetical protein
MAGLAHELRRVLRQQACSPLLPATSAAFLLVAIQAKRRLFTAYERLVAVRTIVLEVRMTGNDRPDITNFSRLAPNAITGAHTTIANMTALESLMCRQYICTATM